MQQREGRAAGLWAVSLDDYMTTSLPAAGSLGFGCLSLASCDSVRCCLICYGVLQGVVKALYEQGQLPRVLAGSSVGAIGKNA